MVRKRAHQPASVNINSDNDALAPTQVGGTTFDDYDVMTSSTMSILSEAESDLDTSGGSVRGQNRLSPSPGMNDWKNSQTTEAWYSHILSIDDLAEVDPPRGKFLLSLQELVTKKQAIQASHEFSTEVTFHYEKILILYVKFMEFYTFVNLNGKSYFNSRRCVPRQCQN